MAQPPSFPPSLFPFASTGAIVTAYCLQHDLPLTTTTLPTTTSSNPSAFPGKLHSFTIPVPNTSSSTPTLLYFHGGGYLMPAKTGHVRFAHHLGKTLHIPRIVLLEYSLAPTGKYPSQLHQGIAALAHLLQNQHTRPSDIILGGDSAGGNLALGLLAHLHVPKPGLPEVELAAPLRAVFGISPRCANETSAASFTSNAGKDVISKATAEFIIENWEPVPGEVWGAANVEGKGFWEEAVRQTAGRVLVLAGADECYLDDIRGFAERIGAKEWVVGESGEGDGNGVGERWVFVAEGAKHAQAAMDFENGIEGGLMTRALMEWLAASRF